MLNEGDRVPFKRNIALLISAGILLMMVYYAFLVPEVADCNNYYEKKFADYENTTQEQCLIWKSDIEYTKEDHDRDRKAAWNISNFGASNIS